MDEGCTCQELGEAEDFSWVYFLGWTGQGVEGEVPTEEFEFVSGAKSEVEDEEGDLYFGILRMSSRLARVCECEC